MKKQIIFREQDPAAYDYNVNLSLTGQNGHDEHGTYSVTFDAKRVGKHYLNSDMIWDEEDQILFEDSPSLVGNKLLRLHCNEIENGETQLRDGYTLLTANIIKHLDPTYNGEVEILEIDSESSVHRSLYLFQKKIEPTSKEYNYYFIKSLD